MTYKLVKTGACTQQAMKKNDNIKHIITYIMYLGELTQHTTIHKIQQQKNTKNYSSDDYDNGL